MTPAARSIYVFGVYLVATGAFILGAPDTFLALLRLPPATDPWFRVLGVVVMAIGMLDLASARAEQTGFFRATVWVRFFVLIAFTGLILLRLAPPVLIVFGLIDAAGAVWTKLALKQATDSGDVRLASR
ncbi:MAG TPA: hypothetical protein VGQ48_06970 [Gemmatimonadales bacterium]|jgi:hypothetical protein|nr:hypothetical protein [Gemmatimonadales bacterium]